jgi:hypothetical protein
MTNKQLCIILVLNFTLIVGAIVLILDLFCFNYRKTLFDNLHLPNKPQDRGCRGCLLFFHELPT